MCVEEDEMFSSTERSRPYGKLSPLPYRTVCTVHITLSYCQMYGADEHQMTMFLKH
jgi:hypothetical protein